MADDAGVTEENAVNTALKRSMESEGRISGSSEFGALLRHYRLAVGLSQESLAERARLSVAGIGALERGYRRTPQRETLALLVGALALDERQREEFEWAATRARVPRREASLTVGPWPGATISSLPVALTSFVGREIELGEIAELLRDHRLVTLTGAGGVGKTRIALELASASASDDDGAVFVALAPLSNSSLVASSIASMLGIQEVPNRSLVDTLVIYLKNTSKLLIIDNCEHVIAEAARVAEVLLSGCTRLRILATSREALKAGGEYAYRLTSLSTSDSEALFSDRARAVDHRFELTNENAPFVAQLCLRLDGIPLAIELAAARINVLTPAALLERLDDRLRILTCGERIAMPRQQTMRATIEWSYDLLSPQEQQVFDRLSVFVGGATLDAAIAVCAGDRVSADGVFDLIGTLVDKSMVVPDIDADEPRFRMLESFRQYGWERLTARGEQDVVARRHAVTYLDVIRQFQSALRQGRLNLGTEVRAELENWRTALEWGLAERGDVALGQRLAGLLVGVWKRFAIVEGRRWITAALTLRNEHTPPDAVALLAYAAADLANELNEINTALSWAELALSAYRQLDDRLETARAQSLLGQCLFMLGRTEEAGAVLGEALDIASGHGDGMLQAGILEFIALNCARRGDIAEARLNFDEARKIYETFSVEDAPARIALNRAEAEFWAGNVDVALAVGTEALTALRAQENEYSIANVLGNMAAYLVAAARYDDALVHAREALNLSRRLHVDVHVGWAIQHIVAATLMRLDPCAEGSVTRLERAARLHGFVTSRFAELNIVHSPTELREYDKIVSRLRASFNSDDLDQLTALGKTMTEERAVEEALQLSAPPG